MPRTTEEILAHADALAARFEDFNPTSTEVTPPLEGLTRAVLDAVDAERNVALWVQRARAEKISWAAIGEIVGTSGEAARQKYAAREAG